MQRSDAEALVNHMYGARTKGDIDTIMDRVTPDITLQLIGSTDHSKVAGRAEGAAAFRQAIKSLSEDFVFANFKVLTLLADGDNIAFHWRADARHPKTDKTVATEVMDFWTLRDGKVASITQACDTAMVNWMTAAG